MPKPATKAVFAFPSADNRQYFIKTQVPATVSYSVYQQPSLLNASVIWYYLRIDLKSVEVKQVA